MSTARDYVPHNAAQFNSFVKRLIKYAEDKISSAQWQDIPPLRLEALKDSAILFDGALLEAQNTPTRANILRRQEAQAATAAILREFVSQFLRFPPVTNGDRAEMGVPIHDTIRTSHTEVTEAVEFEVKLREIRELLIDFWVKGAAHKAKPEGYDGAVIVWDVLDAPPPEPDSLARHTMASRTPFALDFNEEERGKTAYIAAAWQNERGICGKWSGIQSAVIP